MSQLSLDDTLGAAFLGNIAAACFYGITVVQTYIYYGRNGGDRLYLKSLVAILWALDSLHLALVTHAVYTYAVKDFANFLAIEVPVWSILAQVIVTGVSDIIVRGIFCERVWKLSNRNWPLIATIVVTSLLVFGGSIAFSVRGYEFVNRLLFDETSHIPSTSRFSIPSFTDLAEISDILYLSLGTGVAADVLIAASMCALLAQRRTGFSRTDSMVRVLILYSINTGALTSLCALLCLVSYATMPNNFVFIAFYFVLPKLFLNSLLATLNARRPLREANASMMSIPLSRTTSLPSHPPPPVRPARQSLLPCVDQSGMQIQVHTSTELKTDPAEQPIVGGPDEASQKFWQDFYAHLAEPVEIGAV
ncbi:hypothetical protein C8Q77DRAFT_682550 [Trametes polyzona]|nr:hypothetical protein C8Q77DRAFT_682550 [Trametes polyzona]